MAARLCFAVLAVALCVCVDAGLTLFGNCRKGAQCAGRPLVSGYAVCCSSPDQSPVQITRLFQLGSTTYLQCRCAVEGDTGPRFEGSCWQGSQCNSCPQASSFNGQWLCCPNCAGTGMTIINGHCSC